MNYLRMIPSVLMFVLAICIFSMNIQLEHARADVIQCRSEVVKLNIGIKLQNDTIDGLFKETQQQRKLLAQRQKTAGNELAAAQKQSNVIMHAHVPTECCKALGWGATEGPKLFP